MVPQPRLDRFIQLFYRLAPSRRRGVGASLALHCCGQGCILSSTLFQNRGSNPLHVIGDWRGKRGPLQRRACKGRDAGTKNLTHLSFAPTSRSTCGTPFGLRPHIGAPVGNSLHDLVIAAIFCRTPG